MARPAGRDAAFFQNAVLFSPNSRGRALAAAPPGWYAAAPLGLTKCRKTGLFEGFCGSVSSRPPVCRAKRHGVRRLTAAFGTPRRRCRSCFRSFEGRAAGKGGAPAPHSKAGFARGAMLHRAKRHGFSSSGNLGPLPKISQNSGNVVPVVAFGLRK